jgi:XRE family transcriptional regulator, aerobic/anaerobic benzoate catabolism transcriptional regulator
MTETTLDTSDDLLEPLGRKVRVLRAGRGMTRKMLAVDSAVSERYLAQLEQGKGNISIGLLQRVATALRTDIADLLQTGNEITAEQVLIDELVQGLDNDDQHRALQLLYQNFSATQNCKRIALVGMRGAGKTSLGNRLAEHLEVPFVQMGTEIEKLAGMPVAEILSLSGQDGYRRLEEKALLDVLARLEKCVIETGGSIVSESSVFNVLLTTCRVVWIKALPEEHMQRVMDQGDMRPIESNDHAMADLRRILEAREPFYVQAHAVIDTSGSSLEESFRQLTEALS